MQQQHTSEGHHRDTAAPKTRRCWPLRSCNSISTSWERPGDPSRTLRNHLVLPFTALPQSALKDGPFTWQGLFIACSTSLCFWAHPDPTHKKKRKVGRAGCQCKLPWQNKCITKMLLLQAASVAAWKHMPSAPMVRKKTCSGTRRAGRSQPCPSSGLLKHHL